MTPVPDFPALKAERFKRLLVRELGYAVLPKRGKGGHEILVSDVPEHGRITWAFYRREVSSIEVRRVLIQQVGLTMAQAKEVVERA